MPRARLGQHFLKDVSVARRIIDSISLRPGELVIEVGAGTGSLTQHLVPHAASMGSPVLLVEIDGRLADSLAKRYGRNGDVRVVCHDVRDMDLTEALGGASSYTVVGNLPYYAGTPIVRRFLEASNKPREVVVMLQREVASEMVARPNNMSLLSLAVQIYASGAVLFDVEPAAFSPPPKVMSSVLRLTPHATPVVDPSRIDAMFKVARSCFRGKRKQLHNSLSGGLGISAAEAKLMGDAAGIDTSRRPATLALEEWVALAEVWESRAEVAG